MHLCSLKLLDSINLPSDLKKLRTEELPLLCEEIRTFFIDKILKNGGHFSANLGVVELTVALHYVFDLPLDKLVWDVGHQAYIHKLLTGRKAEFDSIRKIDGLSGFPKISESEFDHFGTGHSSTSISAILGMAEASLLDDKKNQHIAVIGDGSLTGGMAFEALNNLGVSKANVLVIVNDNQMGIDPNLGAINRHLADIESSSVNIFQNLGLPYQGPIDGHDVLALVTLFEAQKEAKGPRVLHLKTLKGKGYEPAEIAQTDWHSVSYVKIDPHKKETREKKPLKFQDVFGLTLLELAEKDERVIGVTPAMPSGSSMKIMMEAMPHRVFDVGIAEQHAVTFSAGLTLAGKRVFCNIYSSFAQRAFDQIIHDVALQNIPVIFCLDRAGLVGEDGPTHHGAFDLAFLNTVPNLKILAPLNEHELRNMMHWAADYTEGPVVIRYPRGRGSKQNHKNTIEPVEISKANYLTNGNKVAIISLGEIGTEATKAIKQNNWQDVVTHIDARFMKPLDEDMLEDIFSRFTAIITLEDGCIPGGFGMTLKAKAFELGYKGAFTALGIPDEFIEHGEVEELRHLWCMDADFISSCISLYLNNDC